MGCVRIRVKVSNAKMVSSVAGAPVSVNLIVKTQGVTTVKFAEETNVKTIPVPALSVARPAFVAKANVYSHARAFHARLANIVLMVNVRTAAAPVWCARTNRVVSMTSVKKTCATTPRVKMVNAA